MTLGKYKVNGQCRSCVVHLLLSFLLLQQCKVAAALCVNLGFSKRHNHISSFFYKDAFSSKTDIHIMTKYYRMRREQYEISCELPFKVKRM